MADTVLKCVGRRRIIVSKTGDNVTLAVRLQSGTRMLYVADLVLEPFEEKKLWKAIGAFK